jgi:hypothetical protein
MKASLKRDISMFEATTFGIGIILGAGIYAIIGPAAASAHAELERPFKVPLNIGKFPLIPFLGLLSCIFLASHLDLLAIFLGVIAFSSGALVYKLIKK